MQKICVSVIGLFKIEIRSHSLKSLAIVLFSVLNISDREKNKRETKKEKKLRVRSQESLRLRRD